MVIQYVFFLKLRITENTSELFSSLYRMLAYLIIVKKIETGLFMYYIIIYDLMRKNR